MAGNTFGTVFRLTSFGESHGPAIGGVIDGCPSNMDVDFGMIDRELAGRRPGITEFGSPRREQDRVEFLSGIFEGKTTGSPIGFIIRNNDSRPADYDHLRDTFRPSHGDFVYQMKYGIRDHMGGGRSSARETAVRVVGGAFARMVLQKKDIRIVAYVSQIGEIKADIGVESLNREQIERSLLRCPDKKAESLMFRYLTELKQAGDTAGGVVECCVSGAPAGLGEPVFDKLNADLAKAMLSINAVKGFEVGSGFRAASMKGSEHNDPFLVKDNRITFASNNSGGIQAGISNGADILFRVAFKAVATLMSDQKSYDSHGNEVVVKGKGRHDVCVVPRAVPIVEAMTALTLADHLLRNRIAVSGE